MYRSAGSRVIMTTMAATMTSITATMMMTIDVFHTLLQNLQIVGSVDKQKDTGLLFTTKLRTSIENPWISDVIEEWIRHVGERWKSTQGM